MEANRVTRSDLARCLGVSPAYVTKVLRGNVNPSAPQHQRWGLPSTQAQAEGLRVDPERRVKHRLKAEVLAPSKDQFHRGFDGASNQGSWG
jgi:streptogramin lyase